ncbi:MAG: CZB domain-containing protein [Bacteroidales bacterium]
MELNFFYAKHKHRMWRMKLKAYLLDLDDLDEREIISSNDCILGKWLNEYGWEAYKDYPEMKEFVDLHEKIHEIVSEMPKLKKANKLKKADEKYRQLEQESDTLINLLEKIQEKEEAKAEDMKKQEI